MSISAARHSNSEEKLNQKKIVGLMLAVSLLSAANVGAFDWFGGRLSLGGGYGRAKPEFPSTYKDSSQDGQMWTVNAKYFLNDSFSLVASYADNAALQPHNRRSLSGSVPLLGLFVTTFFKHLPITPHITAGAGVSINKVDVPDAQSVKWNKFAFQGGAGLEFFINQGTALGVEALYHSFMAQDSNVPYRLVSLVGTMSVYFGEGPATGQEACGSRAQARADAEKAKAGAGKSSGFGFS